MLQVRKQEQLDIVGHRERITFRVRHHQRRALLVELDLAVGLDDLRAITGGKAARQKAVAPSDQRVSDNWIGEGKIHAGIKHVRMLIGRPARLAETIIGEGFLAAGNMRHQPFEHRSTGLVGIEAEIEIILQITSALRSTEPDGVVDAAGEGINVPRRIGGLVAKKRNDVAGGGEAEPHHLGVFGGVDEFVDRAGVEILRAR
jgi:hypothetical protein